MNLPPYHIKKNSPNKYSSNSIVTKYEIGMFSHFDLTLGDPSIQNVCLGFSPLFHYLCLLPEIGR